MTAAPLIKCRCFFKMDISKVTLIYFSPSGETARIGRIVACQFRAHIDEIDITCQNMPQPREFGMRDLVIVASPCHGGRVPEPVARRLTHLMGRGTPAIPIIVFAGRTHDDSLRELGDILTASGCVPIAAAAISCELSPDAHMGDFHLSEQECAEIRTFAIKARVKLGSLQYAEAGRVMLEKNQPYRRALSPRIKPMSGDGCVSCGLCARMCPAGAIDFTNPAHTDARKCIACMRCVKGCPHRARSLSAVAHLAITLKIKVMRNLHAANTFILDNKVG